MKRLVLHHEGSFLEWSETLAAPVTTGMSKSEVIDYLCGEGYVRPAVIKAIEQAAEYGVARIDHDNSAQNLSFQEIIETNRAGGKRARQDPRQIIDELFVKRESLF